MEVLVLSVGGGGLMAGVAAYAKTGWIFGRFSLSVNFSVNPLIQIVGCQPEASPVMLESVRAGRVVDWESKETLSGFSMRTLSCWMWWSSGRIMSRLLLIFSWRAKRLSQVFL